MPPTTRTALAAGLGVFLLTILVFHPHAGGGPAASPLESGVLLIPPGDPRTESIVLLDVSAAYLPGRVSSVVAGQGEVGQPLDAPFAKFDPVLMVDPSKSDIGKLSDRLPLEAAKAVAASPAEAIPLAQWEALTTFGMKSLRSSGITGRSAFFEVYAMNGGLKPIIYGKLTHPGVNFSKINIKKQANAPLLSNIEVILGLDSMGKHGSGSLLRSSGDPVLDEAVLQWSAGVDWARQLPPGSYRLTVGP